MTTTENPATYSIYRTLADYDLHHSGEVAGGRVDTTLNRHPAPQVHEQPRSGWETEYRRVPPYRPANPELDFSLRNQYNNGAEYFFISNMFGGIAWVEVRKNEEFSDMVRWLTTYSDSTTPGERLEARSTTHTFGGRWEESSRRHLAFYQQEALIP